MYTVTYKSDIKTKRVTAKRFEYIVEYGLLQETEVDDLDVREGRHKFEPDAHKTAEFHVFKDNGHGRGRHTLSDPDAKDDLWVDFLRSLLRSHIAGIIWGKGETPIHGNDVLSSARPCSDAFNPGRLCTEGKRRKPKRVEERRSVDTENLVDTLNDCLRQDGFVNEPEAVEEVVDPIRRL